MFSQMTKQKQNAALTDFIFRLQMRQAAKSGSCLMQCPQAEVQGADDSLYERYHAVGVGSKTRTRR